MADDQEFTMWKLGSGLPLDGARVHSTKALFTYNQEYAKNAVVLQITWQVWDGEHDDPATEPQDQLYSVGNKWEPLDGGESVGHTGGTNKPFNDQTNIGRLITSYLTCLGGGDMDKGIKAAMATGAEPNKADFWVGLDVTLTKVEYPLPTKPTEPAKMGQTMVIGELHGRVGEAPAAKTTTASAPASAPTASSNGGGDDVAEHLGQALYRKLRKAAQEAADHDAFMDAAFAMDDVTSDDKAWNKVTERYIMDYSENSLYAQARS